MAIPNPAKTCKECKHYKFRGISRSPEDIGHWCIHPKKKLRLYEELINTKTKPEECQYV